MPFNGLPRDQKVTRDALAELGARQTGSAEGTRIGGFAAKGGPTETDPRSRDIPSRLLADQSRRAMLSLNNLAGNHPIVLRVETPAGGCKQLGSVTGISTVPLREPGLFRARPGFS